MPRLFHLQQFTSCHRESKTRTLSIRSWPTSALQFWTDCDIWSRRSRRSTCGSQCRVTLIWKCNLLLVLCLDKFFFFIFGGIDPDRIPVHLNLQVKSLILNPFHYAGGRKEGGGEGSREGGRRMMDVTLTGIQPAKAGPSLPLRILRNAIKRWRIWNAGAAEKINPAARDHHRRVESIGSS